MGEMYAWFENLYGIDLANYLWGYNCNTETFTNPNLFNSLGSLTLIVTITLVVAYYYFPFKFFNHPRSNRWWNWVLVLVLAGIINFFIAYGWTVNDLMNGKIGECLRYLTDEDGDVISELITQRNCLAFGTTNLIVSSIIFIIGSFGFKWWSPNCRNSPL